MEAIGFPTFRYRLAGFAIAGGMAGLAGALLRQSQPVRESGHAALDAVGHARRDGAARRHRLSLRRHCSAPWHCCCWRRSSPAFTDYWHLPLGLILLAVVFFAPRGLAGVVVASQTGMTLLQVRGLTKRFGGLVATDALDFDVADGEIHAIIGPNGAGKTTLISQLSGALRPDSGTIRLRGVDITRQSAHERVCLGIARSFQVTNLFRTFSAVDNVALAVQAGDGSSFRLLAAGRHGTLPGSACARTADRVGLQQRAEHRGRHARSW